MEAKVTFYPKNKSLLIELVAKKEGEHDFLALTKENMKKKELAARILAYTETEEEVTSVTFSLNVPEEIPMPEDEIDAPPPVPKKSYLC